ncbi:MAG: methyltransferase domain-containing protein [Gaiellales bacterium]
MSALSDGYAPGFSDDALAMLTRRTAATRAAFFLPFLAPGMRVLDVGCGPGTITRGLADASSPGGTCVGIDVEASQIELARAAAGANLSFEVASAYTLPFADGSFDAVFSHALFEHLARPAEVAAELFRVLRPGGVAGVCCSDWGDAFIDPRTPDVEQALSCHLALRRHAGGDPFAGASLERWIAAAGFSDVEARVQHEVDMSYGEFARYIGRRIEAAAQAAEGSERERLLAGAEAARRWAQHDSGRLTQPWTAVTARRT